MSPTMSQQEPHCFTIWPAMDADKRRPSSDFPTGTLEDRMKALETKLRRAEETIYRLEGTGKPWSKSEVYFMDRFAKSVTSIVGLKDAAASEHRLTKTIWWTLVILGISATLFYIYKNASAFFGDNTATKVKFNVSIDYSFPAIALCPYAWMDFEKAERLGVSADAFKYSMLYVDSWYPNMRIENLTKARNEFYSFYNKSNYTSLLEYFKDISLDFEIVNSSSAFQKSKQAIKISENRPITVEKLFINYDICYVYSADVTGRSLFTKTNTNVKFTDRTKGLIDFPPGIWIHLVTDWDFLNTPAAPVYMETGTRNKILISSQRVSTLSTDEQPCRDVEKVPPNYSSFECAVGCQNKLYKEKINCQIFRYSMVNDSLGPTDACHNWEKLPGRNYELGYFRGTEENTNITKTCFNECPERCDRTMYRPFIQWYAVNNEIAKKKKNGTAKDISVEIFIEHIANYEGGTMSLTEVDTFSFIDLVSNVGGVLGLFVGATLMTVMQMIVFFARCVHEKIRKRSAIHQITQHPVA